MSRLFYIVLIIIILFLLRDINAQDMSIWADQGETKEETKERPRRDQVVVLTSSAAGAYNRAVF